MSFRDTLRIVIFTIGMLLAAITPRASEIPDFIPVKPIQIIAPDRGLFLTTDKVVRVTGPMDKAGLFRFAMDSVKAAKETGPVVVLVDSPGGYFEAGKEMLKYFALEKSKGNTVVCVVTGWAASMAFNLYSFCDVRFATVKAKFMFHQIALNQMPTDRRITPKMLKEMAKQLDEEEAPWIANNKEQLHMTDKEYDMHADNETYWTAQTLHERAYVNAIVEVRQ